MTQVTSHEWLLLAFQLPARPTAVRVRVWRQLQRLGAVAVKGGGYVLPHSEAAREDFEWLRADIAGSGGSALLFTAHLADAADQAAIRAEFVDARARDFTALAADLKKPPKAGRREPRHLRAIADRLAHLDQIDFFGAGAASPARAAVQAALEAGKETSMKAPSSTALRPAEFRHRTWVTRPRPGIDRFASAWLIRQFIDPTAKFMFESTADSPSIARRRAVPFDMFGVEFGHQDGRCTFETLVGRFEIQSPGVDWLARVVHALDLKVDDPGLSDISAIGRMVEGLRQIHADDAVLLERGIEMIDALHRSRPADAPQTVRKPARAVRRSR